MWAHWFENIDAVGQRNGRSVCEQNRPVAGDSQDLFPRTVEKLDAVCAHSAAWIDKQSQN